MQNNHGRPKGTRPGNCTIRQQKQTGPKQRDQNECSSVNAKAQSHLNPCLKQSLLYKKPIKLMSMDYILGTNQSNTKSSNIYPYRKDQLLYYVNNQFIKYNINTRQYTIYQELHEPVSKGTHKALHCTTKLLDSQQKSEQTKEYNPYWQHNLIDQIKQQQANKTRLSQSPPSPLTKLVNEELIVTKYFPCGVSSVMIAIKKIQGVFYLSVFWTELNTSAVLYRISQTNMEVYINFSYHTKKGYIYLLYKKIKHEQSGSQSRQAIKTVGSSSINNKEKLGKHSNARNNQIQEKFEKQQFLKIMQIQTPEHTMGTIYSNRHKPEYATNQSFFGENEDFCKNNQDTHKQKINTHMDDALQINTHVTHRASNINQRKNETQETNIPKHKVSKIKHIFTTTIKKTGGGLHELDDLIIADDYTQLYIFGADYFRQWRIMYNQKSIKESNYRNIQRNIKKQKILSIFWIPQSSLAYSSYAATASSVSLKRNNQKQRKQKQQKQERVHIQNHVASFSKQNSSYLVIVTTIEILFVYHNQLVNMQKIPDDNPFKRVHRQTAQIFLQKSLNQIYKNKFRVQSEQVNQQNKNDQTRMCQNANNDSSKKNKRITSASNCWIQTADDIQKYTPRASIDVEKQKQLKYIRFCAAFQCGKVFIYKIMSDLSIKIENAINTQSQYSQQKRLQQGELNKSDGEMIKNIHASPDGKLIVLTNFELQNFINSRGGDLQNYQIDPIYSIGHGHTSEILSISAPQILNNIVTVQVDGSLKIWSRAEKQRCLLIDCKFKLRPLQAIMHPCGFTIIVNFGFQIKIYGIISNQLQQIVSIKTNDFCSWIDFNKMANFIVSNEKNIIKIYDPFTLHSFTKIQPDDLRLQYKKVRVSDNGEYIVYQCCNQKVYRQSISTMNWLQNSKNIHCPQTYDQVQHHQKSLQPIACHRQSQQYTDFYFNFGSIKNNSLTGINQQKIPSLKSNIFVGFTKTKFMTIYSNYGQNLVAEFPVVNNLYVTDFLIDQHTIFVATNKGTLLGYKWPILQEDLQLKITEYKTNEGKTVAHYNLPIPVYQFKVWKDSSPITCLGKIPNINQLVVGSRQGLIGFLSYCTVNRKTGSEYKNPEVASRNRSQRRRMIDSMNNLKLMKISQIDKISKLIQKTQKDIEKIEYQIQSEKQKKANQLNRQQNQLKSNVQKRKKAYNQQCNLKFMEQEKEKLSHQKQYQQKKSELQGLIRLLENDYDFKIGEEKYFIDETKKKIERQKKAHKENILKLIDDHKQNIRKLKDENVGHIRLLQKQFQSLVKQKYSKQLHIQEIKQLQQESNPQIQIQKLKVLQLQEDINRKQLQLKRLILKSEQAKKQDEQTQKYFERNLQQYNDYRYENLVLHSELLKIQNQLHERKQILNKKDQIIKQAHQQKEIYEIYKQYVSDTISNFEDVKQKLYGQYIKKEEDLRLLFQQLTIQIKESENKKLKYSELQRSLNIYQHQIKEKQLHIKTSIQKLRSLKKYLLVQGASEDSQHKRFYQEQQKLLTAIKWLQKRFRMNCINEKKLTFLKKSGVHQIINQNKNLLQECNQLREEGIVYENQIENLGKKLHEANQMIQLQKKVKHQKTNLAKQTEKLAQIRKMFNDQIELANQNLYKQQPKQQEQEQI